VRLPELQAPWPKLVVTAATAAAAGLRVVRHGEGLLGG
jgi:hypothetical protein